jgi:membrane protein
MAGTLVFFLIMSSVPLFFWLTLLIGRLPIDVEEVFDLPVFASVKEIFIYVQREASQATSSASLVLLCTTLYSATNLFYQMRHSGELIYEYRHEKQGLRMRVSALALLFIVMALVISFLSLFALGAVIFSKYFSGTLEKLADYTLLAALGFVLVLLLNAYVCPYKTKIKYFLSGTVVTILAWTIAVIGFAIYLRISNMRKLYGALSAVIVFLLWLYVMTICFVVGVILNSERIIADRKEKAKRQRKRRSMHKKSIEGTR